MSSFFNSVHITNFKSLKDVTLSDCKRINLLIGKPNVGKSNILEAIGLFSLPYFKYNKSKKLTQFVRLENIAELFFDGNVEEIITIHADNDYCNVKYLNDINYQDEPSIAFEIKTNENDSIEVPVNKRSLYDFSGVYHIHSYNDFNLSFSAPHFFRRKAYPKPRAKYYKFPQNLTSNKQSIYHHYLIPPVGVNLLDVIESNKLLKDELSGLFSEYGLKLLFDKASHTLRIMKELKNDKEMTSFPYSSIADTLQRIIFFKTAIASNKNSILLFEEPEAHCFPPYITHIAKEIISSESNQFFIATHSPYILDTFLEDVRVDLAIFMADFKDGQTVIKRLTDAELNDVYEYGLDLFFNAELFTDEM